MDFFNLILYWDEAEEEIEEEERRKPYHVGHRMLFPAALTPYEHYQRFCFDEPSVAALVDLFLRDVPERTTGPRPVSKLDQMRLTLSYLASYSITLVLGDMGGVSKTTAHDLIWECLQAIVAQKDHFVNFGSDEDQAEHQAAVFMESRIPNVIGYIDCTHVKIHVSRELKASYMNRKGQTSFNIQAVSDRRCRFLSFNASMPGSNAVFFADSNVLTNSRLSRDFENGVFRAGVLLGDAGYKNGKRWLLTPFEPPNTAAERRYNKAQKKQRVRVEMAFGRAQPDSFEGLSDDQLAALGDGGNMPGVAPPVGAGFLAVGDGAAFRDLVVNQYFQ